MSSEHTHVGFEQQQPNATGQTPALVTGAGDTGIAAQRRSGHAWHSAAAGPPIDAAAWLTTTHDLHQSLGGSVVMEATGHAPGQTWPTIGDN